MNKNNKNHYFPLGLGIGILLGLLFDNLTLFMCIGVALGLIFSNNQNK